MKMGILIVSLVCFTISTHPTDPAPSTSQPTPTSSHSLAQPEGSYLPASFHIVQNNSMSQDNKFKHEHTIHMSFPKMLEVPRESVSNVVSNAYDTIKTHNKKLALVIVLAGYLITCYEIYSGDNYSEQTELWANWRDDLSLEQLLNIPHEDLTQELLTEIQRRYISQGNPTDFVSPLTHFLNSLENEIKTLTYYKQFNEWIHWSHISKLLPTKSKTHFLFDRVAS